MSLLKIFSKVDGLDVSSLPTAAADSNKLNNLFTLIVGIAAAIAVLIIVLAGFKYITSSGDPQGVASARKAILYAAIGLIVCGLAWSIVTFVIKGI